MSDNKRVVKQLVNFKNTIIVKFDPVYEVFAITDLHKLETIELNVRRFISPEFVMMERFEDELLKVFKGKNIILLDGDTQEHIDYLIHDNRRNMASQDE